MKQARAMTLLGALASVVALGWRGAGAAGCGEFDCDAFVPMVFSMQSAPGTAQLATESPSSHPSFTGDGGFQISRFPFYRGVSPIRDFITPKLMRDTLGKKKGDPLLVADAENDFIFDDGWWTFTAPPRDRFFVVLTGYDLTVQKPDYHTVSIEEGGGHGVYFMGDVDADGCEDQMFWAGDHRDVSQFHGAHTPIGWFPQHLGYYGSCFLVGGTGIFTDMKGEITVFVQANDPDGVTTNANGGIDTAGEANWVDSIQRGQIKVAHLFSQPPCQVPVDPGQAPKMPCNVRSAPVNIAVGGSDLSGGPNDCGRASDPADVGLRPGCSNQCAQGVAPGGPCRTSRDCIGGHLGNAMCVAGVCQEVCVPSGGGCFASSDCCSQSCVSGACS